MEKFDLRKEKIPFTQIANSVLNNSDLSAKAKGIYAYMYSKPIGWDFSYERIVADFKDNKHSILSGLKELESVGLLIRKKLATGKVNYHLFIDPKTEIPDEPETENQDQAIDEPGAENPYLGKSLVGKISTISNKEDKEIKNNTSNKESTALAESKPKQLTPKQNTADFFSSPSRQEALGLAIAKKYSADPAFVLGEMKKFVLYWTEPTQSGRAVRWEKQQAFEINRRLATWFGRLATFTKNNTTKRERKIWK